MTCLFEAITQTTSTMELPFSWIVGIYRGEELLRVLSPGDRPHQACGRGWGQTFVRSSKSDYWGQAFLAMRGSSFTNDKPKAPPYAARVTRYVMAVGDCRSERRRLAG